MRSRIDCVIFDFGGVLSLPREPSRAAIMAELCGLEAARFQSLYLAERDDLDRGLIDGSRYWSRIAEAGGRRPDPALLERLAREDSEAWTRPNAPIHAWAAELRSLGIVTAILSNMPRYMLDFMASEKRFGWLSGFTPSIFSCDIGLLKPMPEIYTLCLERVGFPAGRCLFIDDHSENVEAARKLGIHAVLYGSPAQAARDISRAARLPTESLA